MEDTSYLPVIWLLGILSIFVTIVTNWCRHSLDKKGINKNFGLARLVWLFLIGVIPKKISVRLGIGGIGQADTPKGKELQNEADSENSNSDSTQTHYRGSRAETDMTGVYRLAVQFGILLALVLKANILEILKNPGDPALFLGWVHFIPPLDYASSGDFWEGLVKWFINTSVIVFDQVLGIIITGFVLGFLSKFWNDFFDIIYGIKLWIRKKGAIIQ